MKQPGPAATPAKSQTVSSEELARRAIDRRAVEAAIWGMPAVNYDLMYQALVKLNGAQNQIVYWSHLPDWKNQTLTPNPDAIYIMPFFDTKDVGPVVLEIPAADGGTIVGSVMDCWQTAIEDVGPAGVDKGKGGKYLILPPDHKGDVPDAYIAMPSGNYQGYALLRSILHSGSDSDVAKAVGYAKRIKLYPLAKAANPPGTAWVDAVDELFDSTIPFDLRFFESLNRMVQYEPWLTRDKVMIDSLKTLGIEKGKPYKPDAKTQQALKEALEETHTWIEAHYDGVFEPPFNEGKHWALPASSEFVAAIQTDYTQPNVYPLDARGLAFSYAFFSAKHLGAGQYYLMTIKDKNGSSFEGSGSYKLTVPANAPVKQYWSATVYDRATHAFIRNMSHPNRSSQTPELRKNGDGSVDIFFAPKAPAGKESNWIPTDPKGEFEVLFRLYGPEKALFDKTWVLPDIEKVQ
jgi:hypothetical protein